MKIISDIALDTVQAKVPVTWVFVYQIKTWHA